MALGSSKAVDDMSDVKKTGYLIKLKTNKRKFFVLRERSSLGPARLEYYDSDKKFRSRQFKRCIDLESCFNIARKTDGTAIGSSSQLQQQSQQQAAASSSASARAKHFAIVLFTKDDCFTVGCENESEQLAWLTEMTEIRKSTIDPDSENKTPQFEHIWQVTVKPKELGNEKKIIPGEYRFCLTNNSVSLIRINEHQGTTIPIDCVKKVGHSTHFVMLEFGRQAVTGPGALWLQVEDSVIAHNIHAAVLGSMKPDPFRLRSQSNTLTRREKDKQRKSGVPSGTSSTLGTGSSRPQRSRTIHITDAPSSSANILRSNLRGGIRPVSSRLSAHDPMFDDVTDSQLLRLTPEATILEESMYMAMNSPADQALGVSDTVRRQASPSIHINSRVSSVIGSETSSDYLDMKAPNSGASSSDYLDMNAPNSTATLTPVSSARQTESLYLNMTASASSTSPVAKDSSEYMAMSPSTSHPEQPILTGSSAAPASRAAGTPADEYMSMDPSDMTFKDTSRTTSSSQSADLSIRITHSLAGSSGGAVTTPVINRSSGNLLSANTTSNSDAMRARSGSGGYMMVSSSRGGQGEGSRVSAGGRGNDREGYMFMNAPSAEGYLSMGARRSNDETGARGSSSSVSSVVSSVGHEQVNEQIPLFTSLPRLPETPSAGDGYMEMSSPPHEDEPLLPYERPRLATVHCCMRESTDGVPYRTFSVGSKPFKPTRKTNTSDYLDMSGRKALQNWTGRSAVINSELYKSDEKSSSAPHLSEEVSSAGVGRAGVQRTSHVPSRSQLAAGEQDDRFMMLEFDHGNKSPSGSNKDDDFGDIPRLRTASGGSRDLRMKAFSFSGAKEAFSSLFKRNSSGSKSSSGRLTPVSKLGSSRTRTESFGLSQPPRPRAATEGTASHLREINGLRESGQKPANGSEVKRSDSGYMEMNRTKSNTGYMEMKPNVTKNGETSNKDETKSENISQTNPQVDSSSSSSPYLDLSVKTNNRLSSVDVDRNSVTNSHQVERDYMDMKPAEQQKSAATPAVVTAAAASAAATSTAAVSTVSATAAATSDYMAMNPVRVSNEHSSNVLDQASSRVSGTVDASSNDDAYMPMSPVASSKTNSREIKSGESDYLNMDMTGSQSGSASNCVTTSVGNRVNEQTSIPQITYASLDLGPSKPLQSSTAQSRRREHEYAEIDFSASSKK